MTTAMEVTEQDDEVHSLSDDEEEYENPLAESDARAYKLWRKSAEARYNMLMECEHDTDLQAEIIEMCRRDPVFFINHFAWTYDPRNTSKGIPNYVPFELYPRQVELIEHIGKWRARKQNASIPKCRGVGASWVFIAYCAWACMFESGFKATFGSRIAKNIDKLGDPDSLLEKARILLRRLPSWFRQVVIPSLDLDEDLKLMALIFPDTGSSITGEVGKNMGVGGRASMYVWDEAAKSDNPVERLRGVLNNTEMLVEISTPNGVDNPFYTRIKNNVTEVFYMPWDCVPWRDATWLEVQREKSAHDPKGFAQEVMINFIGSEEGSVIPHEWVLAAVNYPAPGGSHVSVGLDVALSGDLNVCTGRCGPSVFMPEAWSNALPAESARRALAYAAREGAEVIGYDVLGIGEGIRSVFGELDASDLARFGLSSGFHTIAVVFSAKPTRYKWPDKKRSTDLFTNLRAELYWHVRERFRKTFENVHRGASHPGEECISIPNHPELVSQLSWAKEKRAKNGKIAVESKDEMKKRRKSNTSPDYADSLVYSFADDVLKTRKKANIGWN